MRSSLKKNFFRRLASQGFITALSFVLPNTVFAAGINNFADIVRKLTDVMSATIPGLFSLALLLFFWGIAKFVLNTSDEKAVAEGRKTMFYGIIALFVIFSVWGIIRLLEFTFLPP